MDIFRAFLSAISSQWREPTKSVEELKSLSIFAFAQEVCSRLQHEIELLPKEHSKSAPRGIFRGNLVGFQAKLMAHGEALNDDDAKRTRTALNMLEHLCRWPNPYYPVGPTDNSFSPAWYPYLRDMLLSNGECVRESLKAFFDDSNIKTAKKFWIRLIVSLDAAGIQDAKSTLRGPDLSELWERRNTIETCQDKEPFIVSLHNSLMKHCHCRCEPACDFIAANIRLNCNDEPPYPDNTVSNFNLLFQDLHDIHDNQNSQANCYWRDIQISVCATTTTRVTFEELSDDKKPEECDGVSEGSELLDELGLCQIITEARESQLQAQLIYSRGELRLKEEESVPSRRFITNVPSTSLASLLHCSKLTDRHKAILSYHLIDSVWQYYDCNWEVWSNETVHFMSEREGVDDSSEVVFVNQPFLHARFNDKMMLEANDGNTPANRGRLKRGGLKQSKPVAKPNQIQERKSHRYPKILALGIMLLEIQLGRKLESFKTPDYYDRNPHIAQHLLALDLLKDKKLWPPENAWIVIKEIIEMCIDEKKAKAILKDDSREIRQKIYDQIVAPFRVFIQEAWKPKSIEDVDSVTLEKAREPKGNENIDLFMLEKASRSEKDVTQVMEGLSHLSMNEQSLYQSIESAKEWLQKLDHLTEMLSIAEERDTKNCPQIKIAILDTGIEKEYYDDFKDFIEEYKDFASGKDEYQQDETGHGSSTLRLLLKLNFDVKVFIGRVFKRNEADNETERVMAKAIMHAKLKWKVDIICIPSGFSPYPPDQRIRDELYDAVTATPVDSKTLIFAAASNLGFRSEITYPGCLSQSSKLMCLFSTAGDGDPESPRFNPAAVPNTYNFALLGEGIKIDETDEKAVGGTSFSTVIAAAIAAYIMDFANHPDIKGKIRDVRYLREVEGMTSVFASMTALRKNGYHILEPWKLMDYDQCTLLDKKEQREEIRRNISAALRKRYSRRHL